MKRKSLSNRKLYIFVAGSIKLKAERDALKSMVQDLNANNRLQRLGIDVDIKSYENDFKNQQEEYIKYVKKKSDLVFFVITDKIGNRTELELKEATLSYLETNRPEICIFIQNEDTLQDSDSRVIKVREYLGEGFYAIRFKDTEELKIEARKRVMKHVGIMYRNIRDINEWIIRIFIVVLMALVVCFGWKACDKDTQIIVPTSEETIEKHPIILFAGGGSAAQVVKQNYTDVLTIENSMYARMPSSHAWTLLVEDIITPPGIEYDGSNRKFYPVCLSAEAAPDTFFTKQCNENRLGERSVVSYYLGEDDLVLYIDSEYAQKKGWKDSINCIESIEVNDLVKLLKEDLGNVTFYSTSIGSGTMDTYQKVISYCQRKSPQDRIDLGEMMKQNKIKKYTELSFECPNEGGYIVMGSKYYFVADDRNLDYHKMTLTFNGQVISKDIYLYFNCYNNGNSPKFEIPKEVMEILLKYFHIDKNPDIWNKTLFKSEHNDFYYVIHNINKQVFVYLNERPDSLVTFWGKIDNAE